MHERDEAKAVVRDNLDQLEAAAGEPLGILEEKTIEKTFGWVFFYNTQAYIESGEMKYMLAGNAPFIVDVADGSLKETGTSEPIEFDIDEYEKMRAASPPAE